MAAFLIGGICVEHRLAADLVDAGVKMAAKVGQHGALQVLIFQKESAPGMIGSLVGQIVAQRVGIVESAVRILIKRWIGIGRCFFIGG